MTPRPKKLKSSDEPVVNPVYRKRTVPKNPFARPDPDPALIQDPGFSKRIPKKHKPIRMPEQILHPDENTMDPAGVLISQRARRNITELARNEMRRQNAVNVANQVHDEFPAPTHYNSATGWYIDPRSQEEKEMYCDRADLEDYCRIRDIDIETIEDKDHVVLVFESDPEWIEFMVGKTVLVPKKREVREQLRRIGKLGKLRIIQRAVSTYLDQNKWAMVQIWRGAGKSDLIIGKILRRICDDPNISLFINSETDSKTIARVRVCKRELQTNQRLIRYYGYLPADNKHKLQLYGTAYRGKWSEAILELKRDYSGIEPTLMGISWQTSQGLGLHFTGGVLDDPWSIKNQQTNGAREKFWEWFKEFMGSLEEVDFIWCICTRKGQNDIYQDMVDEHLFANFVQKLVLQWPLDVEYHEINGRWSSVTIRDYNPNIRYVADDCYGTFTIEWALLTRKLQGVAYFEREYQNNPHRIEGKLFNWNKVKFCDPKSDDIYARMPFEHPEYIYGSVRAMKNEGVRGGAIAYDPAFGTGNDSSLNALVAMSIFQERIYLIWAWVGHWDKLQRITAFNDAKSKFPFFKFWVEKVMAQFRIVKDLTSDCKIHLHEYELPKFGSKGAELFQGQTDAGKKARLYDSWESPIADERFYVMPDCPFLSEFEDEFKNFPDGLVMDFLDAGAMDIAVLKSGGSIGMMDSGNRQPLLLRGQRKSFPDYKRVRR